MEFIDYYSVAKTRYTDLFKNDVYFDALVKVIAETINDYQNQYIYLHDNFLNIDSQIGQGLDLIGNIVGQPRQLVDFNKNKYFGFENSFNSGTFGTIADPDIGEKWFSILNPSEDSIRRLTDEEYRIVLKARIVKNNSTNTTNDFLRVLNLLSGTTSNFIEVLEHGEVNVNLSSDNIGLVSYFLSRATFPDNIFPIQAGYRILVNNSLG